MNGWLDASVRGRPLIGEGGMKKLLFVVPMHISWDSFTKPEYYNVQLAKGDGKVYNIPRTDLPLGPLSISAYLKKFLSLDVKLIDFNAEVNALDAVPFDCFEALCRHFFQQIRDFQPDFVGISSLFSPSFPNFMDCGRVAKEVWPDSIVVGGGNIPTNSYEQIYRDMGCTFFDGLCFGEGEKPMLHLLESDDPRAFLASSDTWITRGKVMGEELFAPSMTSSTIWMKSRSSITTCATSTSTKSIRWWRPTTTWTRPAAST